MTLTKVIYSHSETYPPIPLDNEWRDDKGDVTLFYLSNVAKTNAARAKDFEVALNAVMVKAPMCDVRISWKIVEVHDDID